MIHELPIVKRSILLFLALMLIHFFGFSQNAETPYRIRTIVIDAGHGGKDPGNLGTGRYKVREKDIALDVALRVGGYIEKQFPEIKVLYTRQTDVFIGLNERADIANKVKADLFLSIHCNAFSNPASNGVETFVLGLHRNKENLQVAMKENSAIYLEDDYKTKYEGFDPNSAESIIALTIMQSAYLQQSLSISSYIQHQFKTRVGRRDRGVKQAGFLVLRKTTMPSILVELGFLTHAPEEDFLNSDNGKAYMSSAIFRGFKEYKDMVEDPLPEGYVPEPKEETVAVETPLKVDEERLKQEALEAVKKADQKARQDSISQVLAQEKIKAVADSLEKKKQELILEKEKREKELEKKAKEEKAKIHARIDSLEQVKQEKIAAMVKRQKEIEAQEEKEIADKRAQEKAVREAQEEKARKELETKKEAKEWLEEIKEVKEQELADAKQKAAVENEKQRLEAIKQEKLKELEEVKQKENDRQVKENAGSLAKIEITNAKADSIAKVQAAHNLKLAELRKKEKQDSIITARAVNKIKQDSIDAAKKAEEEALAITIDSKKAATAEEAELLFLQLRKRQLEQRIAQLKGKNVETITKKSVVERAKSNPKPINKVNAVVVDGLVLKVQVVTAAAPLSKTDHQLKGQDVWEYQQGGLYKYTVGGTQNFEEITKLQAELRNLGFKGAFVVAFKDGERIKVSEARKLLDNRE